MVIITMMMKWQLGQIIRGASNERLHTQAPRSLLRGAQARKARQVPKPRPKRLRRLYRRLLYHIRHTRGIKLK